MSWQKINKIKFYCFYYEGISKPVIVEARSKAEARKTLKSIRVGLPVHYQNSHVVGETVKCPVFGVSEKKVKGIKFIWVGESHTPDGWIEINKFPK